MQRLLINLAIVAGVIFVIWMSAVLFIGLAVIGVIGYGLYYARDFLIDKGILNPQVGIPPEESDAAPTNSPVIEGDFVRIDEQEKQP